MSIKSMKFNLIIFNKDCTKSCIYTNTRTVQLSLNNKSYNEFVNKYL